MKPEKQRIYLTIDLETKVHEAERYVFTEYELKDLLIDTFQAGAVRALNINDDSLSVKHYINNLFK